MKLELCAHDTQDEYRTHKRRVGRLAASQFGLVTWAQLRTLGVAPTTITRWISTGYLIAIHPRVYAVSHRSSDDRTQLFSLVLFAGPFASISHGTCAHLRGWLRYPVGSIHISTPRQIRTRLPGVSFHGRRELERRFVNGVPCTTPIQTLLDIAATEPPKLVQRCLAQLDYERKLSAPAIRDACGRGKPGSTRLLAALDSYMPQLARTKSELEDEFLYLCQRAKLPLPQVNALVAGIEVDCYWPHLKLVVELDGQGNHGTPSQRNIDQRKALRLRSHGLTVIRYTWDQVVRYPTETIVDITVQVQRAEQA